MDVGNPAIPSGFGMELLVHDKALESLYALPVYTAVYCSIKRA